MINPEIDIAKKFPIRICSKSMNKRPIKPVMIAPKPVVPNAGIFGFALKRTKLILIYLGKVILVTF